MKTTRHIGWLGIVRLGLVQTSLGAIVVLMTSTLNRVMVVELALPALLPGVLVAIHYFVQIARPRFGHGSDTGRRRTPWIIGGMVALGAGGVLASVATALMASNPAAGIALAVTAFLIIGAGVGASGTCLLVLLASLVRPKQRAAAASITWIMMIAGFAVTAGVAGAFLDPFSMTRLVTVSSIVSALAIVTTALALRNLEPMRTEPRHAVATTADDEPREIGSFRQALADVAGEQHTRRFALFVFLAMLGYSAMDLVLEPFAGAVFGLSPGESTQLGGTQHSGALIGMLLVAFIGYRLTDRRHDVLRACMIGGCLGSAALLGLLSVSGFFGSGWPLHATVGLLGFATGVFTVAAIGTMMGLMARGGNRHEGMRMGIWGAAQAIAFGLGGIAGTFAVDVVRWLTGSSLYAYSTVFVIQAILFATSAILAAEISRQRAGLQGIGVDNTSVQRA